jgi:hypothetical protein
VPPLERNDVRRLSTYACFVLSAKTMLVADRREPLDQSVRRRLVVSQVTERAPKCGGR